MLVVSCPSEVRRVVLSERRSGATIGVVPTMGALHTGHVSLIDAARRECDFVVVTVFVNPTQFGPGEDYEQYPRTLEDDLGSCEAAGADLVFTPERSAMYLPQAQTIVRVSELTTVLEGAHRPTHFEGVTTIVAKLFNITLPNRAYFGQKDYQQQLVIRRMVRDLQWDSEIVTCPIVREADGLAMSSRNRYLSPDARARALALHRALDHAAALAEQGQRVPAMIESAMHRIISEAEQVDLHYAVVLDCETLQKPSEGAESAVALIAATVGGTRLLDNRILQFR